MSILIIPWRSSGGRPGIPREPGGGGYAAQRMLAARMSHATGATLLFNAAHYALRPWPWILIGLISIVVYPDVAARSRTIPTCLRT